INHEQEILLIMTNTEEDKNIKFSSLDSSSMKFKSRMIDFNLRLDRLERALQHRQFQRTIQRYKDVPITTITSPLRSSIEKSTNLTKQVTKLNDDLTNPDHYTTDNARPPFTYKQLIRQAIFESPKNELAVKQIYEWFQQQFIYYRKSTQKWQNAVRSCLAAERCFKRVRDTVWTIDERKFLERRRSTKTVQLSSTQSVQQSSISTDHLFAEKSNYSQELIDSSPNSTLSITEDIYENSGTNNGTLSNITLETVSGVSQTLEVSPISTKECESMKFKQDFTNYSVKLERFEHQVRDILFLTEFSSIM
ncbi:unnamed protein product, partial [Didymodactylos carnosus]